MAARLLLPVFALLLATAGCKTPYIPPEVSSPNSYLVVEGTIITGHTDSTFIRLSHTIKLNGADTAAAETGAQVSVQDQAGKSYALKEIRTGTYGAAPLSLPATGTYRLHIVRSNGSTYQSDYVQAKSSPAIDSVSLVPQADGLHVFVNAHDAANSSRYYRWDYSETWQFMSFFQSNLIYQKHPDTLLQRTAAQQVYTCYQTAGSTSIVLNSTAKLTTDVVSQQPITFVPSTSEKVSYIYSIQVKQHALTPDAFEFWQNLKRNTEQLGSIFDAQPSQLTGNIHNTANATEPVIGYVSAGTIVSKRVFLNAGSAGYHWRRSTPDACDSLGTVKNIPGNYNVYFSSPNPVYVPIAIKNDTLVRVAAPYCADCTTRGTTVKPSFWPY